MFYKKYLSDLSCHLEKMEVTDHSGNVIPQEKALLQCCELCQENKLSKQTIYFVGNGASATMASHMAADFTKNCGCRSVAFNDVALMTAISNDIHYDESFALPLNRFATEGDILVTISSSGNSPNVIKAIESAQKIGMKIITLSGMKKNNRSRGMGDLNFWIPADTYGLAESGHQVLLHCWLDTYLELYGA